MVQIHKLSISHACRVAQISRTKFYYQKIKEDDTVIIDALNAEVDKHPRYGFWALFERLRRNGHCWNHKRVYRIYRALGLNLKRRTKKRIPDRIKQPLEELKHPNTVWSMDFVSDALYDGRRFRMLTIIDEFNREALDIEIDTSLPSMRVIRTLERIVGYRGMPNALRVDNGPEFISHQLQEWCNGRHIALYFNRPGKPTDNARIERFNGSLRRELLDAYLFMSLREVKIMANEWIEDYNYNRAHSALGKLTPMEYLERYKGVLKIPCHFQ